MSTSRDKKPTPNDDTQVAAVVDQTRGIKAQLGEHRAALRRGDRLTVRAVKAAYLEAAARTAVGLETLAGRHDAIARSGADREAIVRQAVKYATRPLRELIKVWGGTHA